MSGEAFHFAEARRDFADPGARRFVALLVGDGLQILTDPQTTGIAGGAGAEQLGLQLMSAKNGTRHETAFTTSIETDKLPPESYQALKPLLPDMFDRIAYRAEGQSEIVQSLNVMLDHFSAEDTDPWSPTLCQEHRNRDLRVCYKLEHREARKK